MVCYNFLIACGNFGSYQRPTSGNLSKKCVGNSRWSSSLAAEFFLGCQPKTGSKDTRNDYCRSLKILLVSFLLHTHTGYFFYFNRIFILFWRRVSGMKKPFVKIHSVSFLYTYIRFFSFTEV